MSTKHITHIEDADDGIQVVGDFNAVPVEVMDELAKGHNDPFNRKDDKLRKLDGINQSQKNQMTRHLKKFASGEGDAHTKQQYTEFITGYSWFDVIEPPFNMGYLAKLYDISAAHHSAVNAKVVNTVGLGWEWHESLKTEEKIQSLQESEDTLSRFRSKVERVRKVINERVEGMNTEDTLEEILWKVWTDYETLGNGYIEIGRTTTGKIGYIGHIPASTIRRRAKRDGYMQIIANRITFFRNYGSKTPNPIGDDSRPNEIIHFLKYAPSEAYYGLPDIISAKNSIAGTEFAQRFNLDYFEHKAVPRYIVTLKGAKLNSDSEKRIVDFLSKGLKGQHHRTMYIPLPGDKPESKVEFKMEPVEAKVTDASFTKYIEHNRDMVFMAHRVPISQTGLNQNVSLGAVRDSTRMFKEQVIRPQQKIIEKKLQPLFRELTDVFDFKLVELTLTDSETQSKIDERYLRWEVTVPNEVRQQIGMKTRDGGDDPVGMMKQQEVREQAAQARQSRTRDSERSGGPDDAQSAEGRNEQGEGRGTE